MRLVQGQKYKAALTLSWPESLASNATVQERLEEAGFTDVCVWGTGAKRAATGSWPGLTQDADLPSQITGVEVLV